MSVAVVGAGVAGVAAARALSQKGLRVRLYERNSLGGRLGAERLGPYQVGLGTTYVKARDPLFQAEVGQLLERGLVSEWNVTPYFIEAPGSFLEKKELKGEEPWYVGRPMGSFVLLEEPSITRCGAVHSLAWDEVSWLVNGEDEVRGLILALPVAEIRNLQAQSLKLLPSEKLEKDFQKGRVAAAFAFGESLQLPFALAFVKDSPISLVLNDTSRNEPQAGEVWVLQTSTEWAESCKGRPEEEVCHQLLSEFARLLDRELPRCDHMKAIHWLYGDGDYMLPEGYASDPAMRLCLCGDWCYNGRVEGAFLSGVKAATGLAELLKS